MTLQEELESHPCFEPFLREVVRQLRWGVNVAGRLPGGSEGDPEGFVRDPITGQLLYEEIL